MMEQDEFRALALTFPEAVESSHFDTADFRVRNKIFATLREADGRAVLKLSPGRAAARHGDLIRHVRADQGFVGTERLDPRRARPRRH